MRTNILFGLFAAALAVFAAVSPRPAGAHPHVWIDMRTELVFDGDGRVAGLTIDWTFDELYTAFVVDDIGGAADIDRERLEDVGRRSLANLREFDYFTEFLVDGTPQELSTPDAFDIVLREGRMQLRFTLPLAEPVSPADRRISYAVFDPTYFVSILHTEDERTFLPANTPADCTTTLEEPNPTSDAISFAQSLDLMDSAPDTLGAMFAERVRLTCS